MKNIYPLHLLLTILCSIFTVHNSAENIVLEQLKSDLTYLSSDQLEGRANFSEGIDKAADYISSRFKEIGLSPLSGAKDYKQHFMVTTISPESLTVVLNDKQLAVEKIALTSTMQSIDWHFSSINESSESAIQPFRLTVVTAEGSLRNTLRELNQLGGKHIVLVNSKHAEMFGRYSRHFSRGSTKLQIKTPAAILIILTDETIVNSIDVNASLIFTEKRLTNVVGVLPAEPIKDNMHSSESILFSAHYDHLGLNEPSKENEENKDTIFNGADDDASGTAAVIHLANHYVKKTNNKRRLIFVAFTGEEIGGFGSKYFSKKLNPEHIIAMINIEMIGKPSKYGTGSIWMTGAERSSLNELMNKTLETNESLAKGTQIFKDPYPKQNLFYRSDNATLARLGVPAHSFSATQLDIDKHYHTVSDEISTIDLHSMLSAIETLAAASQGLVDSTDTPSRIDTSEVRASGKIY